MKSRPVKYLHALQGSLFAFVVFVILTLIVRGGGPSDEAELVLTVSTFLFAILAGFFISRANNRYNSMREVISSEDAYWLSFFEVAGFLGKPFQKKVAEIMDKYYIIAFDFELGEYYKHNAKYVHQLYEELNNLNIKGNDKAEQLFDDAVGILNQIEEVRNKSSVITLERLTKGQWAVMILLAGIVAVSIFILKSTALYSQVTTVVLSTILVLVILIIRDLDNFKLFGQTVVVESGQEVLESIGKLRYYNENYSDLSESPVPKHVEEYRVGYHKPGEETNIKIEKNENYEKRNTV